LFFGGVRGGRRGERGEEGVFTAAMIACYAVIVCLGSREGRFSVEKVNAGDGDEVIMLSARQVTSYKCLGELARRSRDVTAR
jgi:hypothetical protein